MQKTKTAHKQKLFGFMDKHGFLASVKPKKQIRPLIGRGKDFAEFFRLGKKTFGLKLPATLYKITPTGATEIAKGILVRVPPDTAKLITRFLFHESQNRSTVAMEYKIIEEFRRQAYLNKGIATKIAASLLEYAKKMGYERVIAFINPTNKESTRVAEKNGLGHLSKTDIWYRDI